MRTNEDEIKMTATLALSVLILQISLVLGSHLSSPYVRYPVGQGFRQCLPVYDCAPGHEILPCADEHMKAICQPCSDGYVQPMYISSFDNIATTKCFKPQGTCQAHDVVDSRINIASCEFHKFCKCKQETCYYSDPDPCSCSKKYKPCAAGETMNEVGDCVKCPNGTEKNWKGCGPCKHILPTSPDKSNYVVGKTTRQPKSYANPTIEPKSNIHLSTTMSTVNVPTVNVPEMSSQPHAEKSKIKMEQKEYSNTALMTGIVITLAVVVVIGVIVLLVLVCGQRHKPPEGEEDLQAERGQLIAQPEDDNVRDESQRENLQNVIPENNLKNDGPPKVSSERGSSASNSEVDSSRVVDDTALHLNALDKQYVQREKLLPEKITKIVNNSGIVPLPSTDSREGNVKNIGAGSLSIIPGGRENGTSLSRAPEQMSKIINPVTDLRSEDSMSYTLSKRPINIDLTNRDDLNIASLTPGHTQVTDMCSSLFPYPVINQIRESVTSELGSSLSDNDISLQSPMSVNDKGQKYQEFCDIVSGSDRNTESMVSGLEYHNFNLTGAEASSVNSRATQPMLELCLESGGDYSIRQN